VIPFALSSVAAWAIVVAVARIARGRPYAWFAGVILGIHTLVSISLFRLFADLWPIYAYLQAATYAHFLALVGARPRPLAWRLLVSIPASFFAAGTVLALPWALIAAVGVDPWVPWLPYVLAAIGVLQSLWTREEEVDVLLDGRVVEVDGVRRHPLGKAVEGRPLRIVQITDPHIGPFMSVERLRRICRRSVERDPDLVLLTGDFLTMESQRDPTVLTRALEPLSELPGRVFACFGNHDLEAPDVVRGALESCGIHLLVDEEAVVETDHGPVQILGLDFRWRRRAEHLEEVCARFPRRDDHLRALLLHDPGAFRHLPHGEGDIVFSGHTHGGQIGLVSLGLKWTFLSGLTSVPDHGLWARGRDRLYVHRGTGHYGFPLRLGVPAEQSLVRLHRPPEDAP